MNTAILQVHIPGASDVRTRGKVDLSTILGLGMALGGILSGLVLEGGKLSDVRQITAALMYWAER